MKWTTFFGSVLAEEMLIKYEQTDNVFESFRGLRQLKQIENISQASKLAVKQRRRNF
jgi:hypothetical protein